MKNTAHGKHIAELEKRGLMIARELEAAETAVGERLFEYRDTQTNPDDLTKYEDLAKDIDELSRNMDEVCLAAEKRQSLLKSLEPVKKEQKKLAKNRSTLYLDLGRTAVDAGPDGRVSGYDTLYGDITALRSKLAAERLSETGTGGGGSFFGAIKGSFSKMGQAQNIRRMEARLAELYIKAGELIYTSGSLSEPLEAGELNGEEAAALRRCIEYESVCDEYSSRLENLQSELASVSHTLKAAGVTGSLDQFMAGIRKQLNAKRQKQRELCHSCGNALADTFFYADGEDRSPEGERPEQGAELKAMLERVRRIRREQAEVQSILALQQLEREISLTDKKIADFERALEENNREIAEIEQRNEDIKTRAAEISRRREELEIRRGELEETVLKARTRLNEGNEGAAPKAESAPSE